MNCTVLFLLIDIPRSVQNYSMDNNNIYLLISLPKLIMVGVTLWGLLSLLFEMDEPHMICLTQILSLYNSLEQHYLLCVLVD